MDAAFNHVPVRNESAISRNEKAGSCSQQVPGFVKDGNQDYSWTDALRYFRKVGGVALRGWRRCELRCR
jgi:hypothetical protein